MEKLLEQEAMMEEDQKVSRASFTTIPSLPMPSCLLSRAGGYSGSR